MTISQMQWVAIIEIKKTKVLVLRLRKKGFYQDKIRAFPLSNNISLGPNSKHTADVQKL